MTRVDPLAAVAAAVVLLAAVAGVAAAVEVQEDRVPDQAEVGTAATATVTVTDLYNNFSEWRLSLSTQLEDPEWEIVYYDASGNEIDRQTASGTAINSNVISQGRNVAEVEITVDGDVPPVDGEYRYPGNNMVTLITLSQVQNGSARPVFYRARTVKSPGQEAEQARSALDEARSAIQSAREAGANVESANQTYTNAVRIYREGNFNESMNLANQAASEAESAESRSESQSQQTQLILLGVGAVVVLLVVVGAVYYYRQNQQDQTRLR